MMNDNNLRFCTLCSFSLKDGQLSTEDRNQSVFQIFLKTSDQSSDVCHVYGLQALNSDQLGQRFVCTSSFSMYYSIFLTLLQIRCSLTFLSLKGLCPITRILGIIKILGEQICKYNHNPQFVGLIYNLLVVCWLSVIYTSAH